jgi:hypothetical protein
MSPRISLQLCSLLIVPVFLQVSAQAEPKPCRNSNKACLSAIKLDFEGTAESGVFVIKLGKTERNQANLGMEVEPGDQLISDGANAAIELTCPKATSMTFSKNFRAVILPAQEGQACAVDLLSGNLDVLTSEETGGRVGDITFGSKHTNYALRIQSGKRRPAPEVFVYDGEVEVQAAGSSYPLTSGLKLQGENFEVRGIEPVEYDRAIAIYTGMDVVKAQIAGAKVDDPAALYSNLKAIYARVLTNPKDVDARVELAGKQVALNIASYANLTYLNRAELESPPMALLAFTKAAALEQLGDSQKAGLYYRTAVQIDPKIAEKAKSLRVRINAPPAPEAPPSAMLIRAEAIPPSVSPGTATRIVIWVVSPQNEPLSDAAVKVSAGGGLFRETGRTEVNGSTDAKGQFSATWACTSCAPAYVLDIEVTRAGYQAATAQVTVNVR